MFQWEDLPQILLEKNRGREILLLLLSLHFSSSAVIITPCSSQRHFPEDRLGENIFVNIWTDFPLM